MSWSWKGCPDLGSCGVEDEDELGGGGGGDLEAVLHQLHQHGGEPSEVHQQTLHTGG